MEKYEMVKDLGFGNFGLARLMRNRQTNELVAVKFIDRGYKIDENVAREIINHRSLNHPNIIRFKEVVLTPTHLGIVMEYAAGGELFERISNAGRFSEAEARYFFQQLICGVQYLHAMKICHRDLKLENILLDGSPAPRLKICDFGYSKSVDVWSCGVALYVMLVGAYPFEDPKDPRNFRKTVQKIMAVKYKIPGYVHISEDCKKLLSRIFVANPLQRSTLKEIRSHAWFLKNLPRELKEPAQAMYYQRNVNLINFSPQRVEDIMKIVDSAEVLANSAETLVDSANFLAESAYF
ncbi:unnamed protein product [Arabis nemorensis]|uniref:non-specific serine/threonine protein kinase n=1 Tax=Arabis nemorensis TaxID=586526 RepID=A0A565C5C8_9BRAS|nr:unnamed protein product [Arabis nemorensis]